ncbi:uncharacterized protein LOC110227063 [Arabidopsis lyrata subsp. lyrata]|uniref:uncharacterized protein LOC110227063 n=1 Tax=Arabidopsis lyrata subsp. lyrata TaxID=81972 RepID=UPI000A29B440|nr:uncharacterized protein LOC110227063 [Arabidopsis lyrata subsp. lyrata]XP_020875827.1 uncharacterized protein LOC110227063 [Arabidopsis lyrata subsp. lyrata]XP_020875828.1 uncharacterized protein LOC110227063 [Arabidopsis lyrata subsp. lyrata]XP_020875829.1 uncharacterized protein LOC110227063 [Arabidopsis lyrata subsp. lyrata]XP_020875830.1 uncharacterized protein LOC110227063 [Arabidopsis lyrata subsp. lyrata]XP_020875831.1 uncharacterized protein LOC110227063 [Arabidopsis lyrata subsp. l|eukprot:XP_020875826.1 uncharacterized protein LOC110227063 [Arabidopsis lyrata subsp. lyrata]
MLWRVVSQAIPTCSRLITRGMRIESHCPRCPTAEETINHVLFQCPFAKMVWQLSNTPILQTHRFDDDTEDNVSHIINSYQNKNLTLSQKLVPIWLLWRIWKARNKLVFNKFLESPSKIVLQVEAEIQEYINSLNNSQTSTNIPPNHRFVADKWVRPPPTVFKCNFDAGFDVETHKATGGWIIRDNHGNPKAWGSSKLTHVSSPLEAEAKALLVAMQQVWIRGLKDLQFEGDSEILINAVNGRTIHSDLINLIQDIDYWSSKFSSIQFMFIRRSGNSVAHNLAKFSCFHGDFFSRSVDQPLWLKRLVCKDSFIT